MSDRQSIIRLNLVGDWWYYAGALKTLLSVDGFIPNDTPQRDGWSMSAGDWTQDTAILTGKDGRTTVTITIRNPEPAPRWHHYARQLEDMSTHAREMRRDVYGPTGEEVIEIYYRSRSAGSKITLKQLAEQYGFNVTYLSQAKRLYDAAGKWGSKAKKAPK
jgi:hypothetical protein